MAEITKHFTIEPEMVSTLHDMDDEDLRSFAELHEDPTSSVQFELCICTCFLVFKRTGSTEYLQRAVQRAKEWVTLTPDNHRQHAQRSEVSNMLSARMYLAEVNQQAGMEGTSLAIIDRTMVSDRVLNMTWNSEDLNRVVEVAKMVVAITRPDYPHRAHRFSNLGSLLFRRFEQTGIMDNLEHAVKANHTAIEASSPNSPNRAAMVSSLGNKLTCRFQWTGEMQDLDRAFEVTQLAVDIIPSNHKFRPDCLINLARCFGGRFEWMGRMNDINNAVEIAEEAVDAAPCGHPNRALFLINLGKFLGMRFE